MKVVFDITNVKKGSKYWSKELDTVINRYGNWPSLNQIGLSGNILAIPYYSGGKLFIGSYDITLPEPPKKKKTTNTFFEINADPEPVKEELPVIMVRGG